MRQLLAGHSRHRRDCGRVIGALGLATRGTRVGGHSRIGRHRGVGRVGRYAGVGWLGLAAFLTSGGCLKRAKAVHSDRDVVVARQQTGVDVVLADAVGSNHVSDRKVGVCLGQGVGITNGRHEDSVAQIRCVTKNRQPPLPIGRVGLCRTNIELVGRNRHTRRWIEVFGEVEIGNLELGNRWLGNRRVRKVGPRKVGE